MKYNDILKTAKRMGIKPYRMKKTALIQSIQRAENNVDCYGTARVETCNESGCLWREDCVSLHQKGD